LIATGNSRDPSLLDQVERLLADPSPLVRAMAVWASRQLAAPERFAHLRAQCAAAERDPAVLREWKEDNPA
jgi:epoxyqueuosine reductase